MPKRPTRKDIAEEDRLMLKRQANFRCAADALTAAFASFAEVRAVTLFGSVARPLDREVPRFRPFRDFGIEIFHECKDVDLAVRIDRLDNLADLNRARGKALAALNENSGIGVAHHQADIFLFGDGWNPYLGRLCIYGQCPKGKVECLTPGCGSAAFLMQHEGFVLKPDALAENRSAPLFDREHGLLRRAIDLPETAPVPSPTKTRRDGSPARFSNI